MEEQMFYVLSLKWSKGHDDYVWWGPDNNGYTRDLSRAGQYTKKQIEHHRSYYDNEDTMPVPVAAAQKLRTMTVMTNSGYNYQLLSDAKTECLGGGGYEEH